MTSTAVLILGALPLTWAHDEPHQEPSVDTNEWTGFISCAANTHVGEVSPCLPFDPNDQREHRFSPHDGLETIVVGMQWPDGSPLSADRLQIELLGFHQILTQEAGSSPIEFRLDAGDDFDPHKAMKGMNFVVSLPDTPQIVYQQVFDVHYHLFYGEPAPQGYSALPSN